MPYYVQVETTTYGNLTAQCGTADVADRLSNTNSTVAGNDYSFVYDFDINIEQPHNEISAGNVSSAASIHTVAFTVPDYEPLAAQALNVLAGQDLIKQVTLNITAIQKGQQKLLAQYTMSNGMLIDYEHSVQDQRTAEAQKHRGQIKLTFKFEKIELEDKVGNTQGTITTNAA